MLFRDDTVADSIFDRVCDAQELRRDHLARLLVESGVGEL
jgi:hypothetical protein